MGSPCLFTRQQTFKMGYFYWLRGKSSNHLHTELNLANLKGTKFCLERKASFIDISSIASFKPFLIVWLRGWQAKCSNIQYCYIYSIQSLFIQFNFYINSNLS